MLTNCLRQFETGWVGSRFISVGIMLLVTEWSFHPEISLLALQVVQWILQQRGQIEKRWGFGGICCSDVVFESPL